MLIFSLKNSIRRVKCYFPENKPNSIESRVQDATVSIPKETLNTLNKALEDSQKIFIDLENTNLRSLENHLKNRVAELIESGKIDDSLKNYSVKVMEIIYESGLLFGLTYKEYKKDVVDSNDANQLKRFKKTKNINDRIEFYVNGEETVPFSKYYDHNINVYAGENLHEHQEFLNANELCLYFSEKKELSFADELEAKLSLDHFIESESTFEGEMKGAIKRKDFLSILFLNDLGFEPTNEEKREIATWKVM